MSFAVVIIVCFSVHMNLNAHTMEGVQTCHSMCEETIEQFYGVGPLFPPLTGPQGSKSSSFCSKSYTEPSSHQPLMHKSVTCYYTPLKLIKHTHNLTSLPPLVQYGNHRFLSSCLQQPPKWLPGSVLLCTLFSTQWMEQPCKL